MNELIFDIEGDSLTPKRIWCLAANTNQGVKSTTSYDKMKQKLLEADVIIGHNIYRFDVPVLERILGFKIKAKIVDTLALSWYLYPERTLHGLEAWGEDLGVKKPPIIEWDNPEMIEEYRHRCEEDVKINTKLWKKMWAHLLLIYGSEEEVWRFIDYLMFKMDCAKEQERSGWKLDVELCKENIQKLEKAKEEAVQRLIEVMPRVPITQKKTRPAKPYKKDGTWSTHGALWFKLLRDNNLPEDYDGEVEVVVGDKPANPNSSQQKKEWLYGLGWKPDVYKIVKDDDGTTRKIPQINNDDGSGLSDSVLALSSDHPEIANLEGLGVVSHRLSILNGFVDAVDDNGFIQAQIAGLTNTLRFKHKTVVNLPKVNKAYGEIVRGALIAQDGTELCGSDMSSLEDRLKQHYIWPHDPDFVRDMMTPDFDPHLDLALNAKVVTDEAVKKYKTGEDKSIKPIRDKYKTGNYALQYQCGVPRLALSVGVSEKEAKIIFDAYWKRNWAIKEVAKEQTVITVKGQMWLKNPINGFYYSLRFEKDIFSTLVQGSASYVFDLWVQEFRKVRPQLTAQFHDEVVLCIKKGYRQQCEKLLRDAIQRVNDQLKLNRELAIDVQFGERYSDIH